MPRNSPTPAMEMPWRSPAGACITAVGTVCPCAVAGTAMRPIATAPSNLVERLMRSPSLLPVRCHGSIRSRCYGFVSGCGRAQRLALLGDQGGGDLHRRTARVDPLMNLAGIAVEGVAGLGGGSRTT